MCIVLVCHVPCAVRSVSEAGACRLAGSTRWFSCAVATKARCHTLQSVACVLSIVVSSQCLVFSVQCLVFSRYHTLHIVASARASVLSLVFSVQCSVFSCKCLVLSF